MTPGGWIFLILSWGAIIGLCVFCFRLIFVRKAADRLVAPLEIESEWEETEREESSEKEGRA